MPAADVAVPAAAADGRWQVQPLRVALEKLARSTRRELAVVSVAALSRLGDAQSLPVLVACVDSGHLDVADAALQALADMTVPEALTALQNVAADHGEAQIRNRAADLLRTRKAAKELPK